MKTKRTMVEVLRQVFNENGDPLDKDGKAMDPAPKKLQEPMLTAEKYFLLHWGLKYDIFYDENKNPVPVNYTVGICQHIETGMIQTFEPGEIRILGVEF